jgi:hypothetical protein
VDRGVSKPRGHFLTPVDGRGAKHDRVDRTQAHRQVANPRAGQVVDQLLWIAGGQDRPTHMGHGRRARTHHRAGVIVIESGCWRHPVLLRS